MDMRCEKCGAGFGDGELFCPECGIRVTETTGTEVGDGPPAPESVAPGAGSAAFAEPPTPAPPSRANGERTSGLAVASMVLGIAGLTACPLLASILAFIFGIIARREIKRAGQPLKGSGMATAGITLGIIGIAIPVILVSVLVPLGVIFIKPEIEATGKLLDGAAAARIYYFENGNSYEGMRDIDLERIDDSVDFRMSPGRTAGAVYIDNVTDQSTRMYCYSSRENKYTATARADEWRYGFRYWRGPSRWLDDQNGEGLFD